MGPKRVNIIVEFRGLRGSECGLEGPNRKAVLFLS
jgi:hypothetical protein